MLPCARSCVGKKLKPLPAACADSVTTEPLLFLYPRWFQTKHRQATNLKIPRGRTFSSIPNNRGPAATATLVDDDKSAYATHDSRHDRRRNKDDSDGSVVSLEAQNVSRAEQYPIPRSWMKDNWRPFKQEIAETKVRRGESIEESNQRQKLELPRYQGACFEAKVKKLIAKLVGVHSKVAASRKAIVADGLEVDTGFLKWLTGFSGENSWRHHDGSGCTIHVNASAKSSNGKRRLSLVGTARAKEITSQYLKQLETDYREVHQRESIDGDLRDNLPIPSSYQRVDQLPPPEVWSLKSFSDYIGAVVNFSTPKNVDRTLYPKEESFNKVVADILIDLFTTPSLQPFQSSIALRQALSFCSARTDIAFAARAIWLSARRNEILPDVECFNYEINRRLRVRNIRSTEILLDEMRLFNVQPNGATWASFFKHLRSKDAQNRVLQLPVVRALSHDPSSRTFLIEALVDTTFQPSDTDLTCVSDFYRRMHNTFGSEWLTPSIAHMMIERCNKAKAPRTVAKVLKAASQVYPKLDSISFTALLQTTTQTNWFEDVLLLLNMQKLRHIRRLDQKQVELAFKASWKSRLVNVCRVLWHYAASHGVINHNMMMKISTEIAQNVHPERGLKPRFTAWMAVIIVGTHPLHPASQTLTSSEEQAHTVSETVVNIGRWQPVGEARHTQMQTAHVLIERDLTAWQRVQPMEYDVLLDLLEQALCMDVLWQDQSLVSKLSLRDLMNQRVAISSSPRNSQDEVSDSQTQALIPSTEPLSPNTLRPQPSQVSEYRQDSVQYLERSQSDREHSELDDQSHTLKFHDLYSARSSAINLGPSSIIAATPSAMPTVYFLLHYLGLVSDDA